ncbi:MAG TPA: TetR family transcriptional regulator [Bacillaceae bacterium]
MNKRDKIVQASIEVFREKGIEKTKVSDIVNLANIAQGTFYLYFPSKLSVMPAIAEVMVNKTISAVKASVRTDESFPNQLEQVIDAVYGITSEYREVLALIYAGLASTEHIREWETVYEPFYTWMREFLEMAKAAGSIRGTIQAERTSKLMIGLIESSAEQIYLYDYKQDDQAAGHKEELMDFLKHALGM